MSKSFTTGCARPACSPREAPSERCRTDAGALASAALQEVRMAGRYRVGIVGAGIGARHVEGFLALPDKFEIAVIADRDRDRAAALAAKAGAAVHGEFDAGLLARDDLDIIDICLPP